jgi:hypothetical protein
LVVGREQLNIAQTVPRAVDLSRRKVMSIDVQTSESAIANRHASATQSQLGGGAVAAKWRASRVITIGIAGMATISAIVIDTTYPLMRPLAQLGAQIAAAVQAAGENADTITPADSQEDGRFM